jgi:hypothetical protein
MTVGMMLQNALLLGRLRKIEDLADTVCRRQKVEAIVPYEPIIIEPTAVALPI